MQCRSVKIKGLNGEQKQIKNGGLPSGNFLRQRPLEHLKRPLSTDNYNFTPLSGSEKTTTSIKIDTYQNFHDMNDIKQLIPMWPLQNNKQCNQDHFLLLLVIHLLRNNIPFHPPTSNV